MSQGILLFAHSNEQVNYGLLAVWMATRIKKYLDKPVAVVTDEYTLDSLRSISIDPKKYFEHIIINNVNCDQYRRLGNEYIPFSNLDRTDAFSLSPFDETLLLDTDIVIQSDRLNLVWDNMYDLMLSDDSVDVFDRSNSEFEYLKEHGIKFNWATEFYFKKTDYVEKFFAQCKQIKDDYKWKSVLYGIPNTPIRNDHVWSIASHELGIDCPTIPRKLKYSIDRDEVVELRANEVILGSQTDKGPRLINVKDQDIHVMNKYELMIMAALELGVLL